MRWSGEGVWARLPEQADRATAKSATSKREDAINHGKSGGGWCGRCLALRANGGRGGVVRTSKLCPEVFNKFP
jgi:hypothetical protein